MIRIVVLLLLGCSSMSSAAVTLNVEDRLQQLLNQNNVRQNFFLNLIYNK